MNFSLASLKKRAVADGAEFLVLRPGKKLPESFRAKKGRKLWLCVPRKTDRRLLYAAVCRFDAIRFISMKKKKKES